MHPIFRKRALLAAAAATRRKAPAVVDVAAAVADVPATAVAAAAAAAADVPAEAPRVVGLERGMSARGYWVGKAGLSAAELASLRAELTMTPVACGMGMPSAPGQEPTQFPLYRESPSRLYVPKYFGLTRFGLPPAANVTLPDGEDIPASRTRFTGRLREEQRKPVDAYLAAARDPARMGGIVSLPCGFGKTVAALYIVSVLAKRTMVVVHKDFLLNQWRERIAEFLPDLTVGLVKAKAVDVAGKDVVLASLQSLSMKDYDPGLFAGIGMLVIDECHRVGTEVFSRALHKTNFRYSLGISATVTRKDGMTKAFVHFLGDVLFKGKRREDTVTVVQHAFWDADPAYSREVTINFGGMSRPNVSRMINNISEFPPRTAATVDAVARMLAREPGRKVLVLSDRKCQLRDIRAGLEARGIDAGFYWGGMKREALAETEAKTVMCATFAYAAEGMDVPDLDTLVLASPKSDIEQSVGRILRQKAETRERTPLVYDFVDGFSLFERQGAKRAAFYKKHGYQIVDSLP
jgi:superfamily II DNA or RNA helicase